VNEELNFALIVDDGTPLFQFELLLQVVEELPFQTDVVVSARTAGARDAAAKANASPAKTQRALRCERLRPSGIAEVRLIFVFKYRAVPLKFRCR
jgi:hypothetical protein